MVDEVQLIADGHGFAVIGDSAAVDGFLASEGLSSRNLDLPRLGAVLNAGVAVTRAGAEIAANSGRWVKLTEESARLVKKHGLMESKTPGVSHALVGEPGSIKSWLQVVKGPGSFLTNPAVLANVAGLMAQVAMQQAMDDITDYLAAIDEKLDDVLRAQQDSVVADMIGVGLAIEEAMTIREHSGGVNEVTWSKVQSMSATIARTQAYALGQLDSLAEKLERGTKIGDLAATAKEAESTAQSWLAVLARCFQLQDAIAVLELDRVLHVDPDDLDGHRLGLEAVRQERMQAISRSTERLMARMDAAAGAANTKVLLHPMTSPAVVQSRERVAIAVADFGGRLGIESARQSVEARPWVDAATELRDKMLEMGADRVHASKRRSGEALDRAGSVKRTISSVVAERMHRRPADDERK